MADPVEATAPRPLMVLVAIIIAAGCLWFALRGFDVVAATEILRSARTGWLGVAAALLVVSYAARSQRWAAMLGARTVSLWMVLFWATSIGYFLNTVLPARAGDLARAGIVQRHTPFSTMRLLGSTAIERAADVVVLSLVVLLAIPGIDGLPQWMQGAARIAGSAALLLFLLVAVSPRWAGRGVASAGRQRGRFVSALLQFAGGLRAVRSLRHHLQLWTATVAIWALDTMLVIALARAFGITLEPVEGVVLLAALGLASAAPSTPGYVGVFQAVAVAVLVPMGTSREAAIVLVTALQVVTLAVAASLAAIGVARLAARRRPAAPAPRAERKVET